MATFLGLAVAFGGVPAAVRGLVEARTAEELLLALIDEIDRLAEEIDHLEDLRE